MVSPPASLGDGHATQDKNNVQNSPASSLPRNPEVTLDFLAGQKSHGGGENKRMEDKTDDLGSSYKGKAPMVIPDLNETSASVANGRNMTKNGIASSSSKNPSVGVQMKPPTTQDQIFSNIVGALKMAAGDDDGDDGVGVPEEVNVIETAKMRGMKFPRPRWWKGVMPCDGGKLSFKVNYSKKG